MTIQFRKNSSWQILEIPIEYFSEEVLREKIKATYENRYTSADIVEIHYTAQTVFVHLALE